MARGDASPVDNTRTGRQCGAFYPLVRSPAPETERSGIAVCLKKLSSPEQDKQEEGLQQSDGSQQPQ